MKLDFNNLIIEVTRKCNMACDHCLRGEAQNKNIDFKHIDSLLSQTEYISSVTFTGGEPSLYVKAINYFLEQCKILGIELGWFYIATNGLKINEDFVLSCLKMYSYSSEKDMCRVDVSNDYYHAECDNYNTELLDGLSFFGRKNEQECYDYNGGHYLINEGNAQDNFGYGRDNTESDIEDQEDFREAEIYLNCNGKIVNGCDWSYENQNEYILCDVSEVGEYFNNLSE